jgi:hypothetical protein
MLVANVPLELQYGCQIIAASPDRSQVSIAEEVKGQRTSPESEALGQAAEAWLSLMEADCRVRRSWNRPNAGLLHP